MGVGGAREALNGLKWAGGGLAGLTIWYVHRGAPGGMRAVRGEDVLALGRSFIELARETVIPYHRVQRVERGDEVVWSR